MIARPPLTENPKVDTHFQIQQAELSPAGHREPGRGGVSIAAPGLGHNDEYRLRDRSFPIVLLMVPEKELEVITPRDDAMEAFQKLARKEMRQIPVVQNGELVGMLRRRDILRWLQVRSEMMSS